jgi:hypothetical protein
MKMYEGVAVELHIFWPLRYMEMSGQPRAPATLPPGKGAPNLSTVY